MRLSHSFAAAGAGIAVCFTYLGSDAFAAAPAMAALGNSFRPVDATPPTGPLNPRRAMIARSTLTAAETAAPITFEVALKMRNFDEMKARVEKGDHISPQELVAKYEPLARDYQAVVDWLTSQGMTITQQDPHHLAVFAQAPVGKVAQAMHANFARVAYRGAEFTSAITAPAAPATITPLLVGINGLQPHLRPHKHLVRPAASGGSTAYTPAQIASAYQAKRLYTNGITGAGQTIAIVIDVFPARSDLTSFWNTYGIAQTSSNVSFIQVSASLENDAPDEATLDTEWSSAMAPGANIRVYAASGLANDQLDAAYARIYQDALANNNSLGIHEMSMSYGAGEIETTNAQMQTDDQYFTELANIGVTCFASAGDGGSTPAPDGSENGNLEAESPASDPYVIGVGGTSLTDPVNPNPASEIVWNEGASGGATGGGTSIYWTRPSWQTGPGVPTVPNGQTAYRLVPDIACAADPAFGADFFYQGSVQIIGGTSWACPSCAGFCALINQARRNIGLSEIGVAGPQFGALIYPLIGTSAFRDIVSGNNATANSASYASGPGYDETTGVGVPLVQSLAGVFQPSLLATVSPGQNAAISVSASGTPLSYQWQREPAGTSTWTSLTNTGPYSGTQTATLTVTGTTLAMSGDQFQCVVTYAATTVTSAQPTVLTVENPWIISTLASNATSPTQFDYPTGIAIDASGNVFVTNLDANNIREVSPAGVVSPAYGLQTFNAPRDLTFDSAGSLYVADEGSNTVRVISSTGGLTILGTGAFSTPIGVAVTGAGSTATVYVADFGHDVIQAFNSGVIVSPPFAGASSFTAGYRDGAATQALFNQPIGLAVDGSGNVYVCDYGNYCIRKISIVGGVRTVSTLAGKPGVAGCLDGTGTKALFNAPRGIAVDGSGNVFVTDSFAPGTVQTAPIYSGNNILREISPAGVVTTLAGQPSIAGAADGMGNSALLYNSCGIKIGPSGALFIAEAGNNAIRMALMDTVSLAATVPYASAVGPADGQFTVSRVGSVASSLTLSYSRTANSTAVAGSDYDGTNITDSVTIPAGAGSATISVLPLANPPNPTNRTLQLALAGVISGVQIGTTPATVAILETPPISLATFETNHPDPTTPLGDGIADVAKYAFDINPSLPMGTSDRAALPTAGITTIGNATYLTLTYRENAGLSGTTTVTPLVSSDLVTWNPVATTPIVIGIDSSTHDPIMQVQVPYSLSEPEFLRLNVSP